MLPVYEAFYDRFQELFKDIRKCIAGLPVEALDWMPGEEMNTLGVLVTHTMGSTRYWVGDVAAQEPSNRDRDAEFRAAGLDEAALVRHLEEMLAYLKSVFQKLTLDDLAAERLSPRNQKTFTGAWAIVHALEHVGVHVGHMQIIRQLWDAR